MPAETELLNLLVSSAAALIALATGVLVWWQTSQHFRHSRSAAYIERFNSQEYFDARMTVDRLAAEDPAFETILRAEVGRESRELESARLHVLMFANIFQEIGAAYRAKLVDPKYTWSVFGFLAQYYWQRLSPFVLRLRAIRKRSELYGDFEFIAAEMRRLDKKYARYPQPSAAGAPDAEDAVFVFAYGSLMEPESAARTIAVKPGTRFEPARLYGYLRGWTSAAQVLLDDAADPRPMAFLALREVHDAYCNGVLVPVTSADLARLDMREQPYQRTEVTPLVFPSKTGKIYAYTSGGVQAPPAESVVAAGYLKLVEQAAAHYGKEFAADFEATTEAAPFPVIECTYRFADPAQNSAAGRDLGF
ncbi:MAG: hypothetical protein FJW40_23760 [Acidobacteria bacterium]|nr:hypothetical protein [Acidobacteriota bacterium]